jgi:hypothetical protein
MSVCLVSAVQTRSGVQEEVQRCDSRWDPVTQHPSRSSIDVLGDRGADQIGIEVGDVDRIDDNEEDLQSGSVE